MLKEFVDLCHQNGIAVILDVALNHALEEIQCFVCG
jgi:1,4-alpha-glucan branching enzyme